MQSAMQSTSTSKGMLRTGLLLSALAVLFLLFDSITKVIMIAPVVESFVQLGYPVDLARAIGLAELLCILIYILPRTSILGAILLTGFLGGAAATKARFEDPWFLFPIGFGVLIWGGLYLRDERLRALFPLRK